MERKPRTIAVVAGFLFLAAAIAMVIGESLLFPNRLLDSMWQFNPPAAELFQRMGRWSGVPLILLAIATGAAGIGFLRRKQWSWWFAILLFAVDGLGDALSFFATGNVLKSSAGLLISGTFVYFLSRRPVRLYFARSDS